MQLQRRRDTKKEWQVRRRLHAAGLRYRVDFRPEASLRCRGDIVFTRSRVVVFIDGCFWHGCPVHATQPRNNAKWWREKLNANIERDRRNSAALRLLGWRVLRFWEHEHPDKVVRCIVEAIQNR
ncbi:very short patch repair endonuclease [Williamsia muralis]|uniref:very short patch repair endonuclease n=1 Tax=Williamsia marianensis TaxID=85044 RepID=UPI00380176FB